MASRRAFGEATRRVMDHAEQLGWTWSRTARGHLKFVKAGCQPVFFGGTPGDRRAWRNGICNLNKANAACRSQPIQP